MFSGETALMWVIKRRIVMLLKDKEETAMSATIAGSWLNKEASSFESICRAGTLRFKN